MSEYSAPPWAGTPAEEFSLECLKGGAIVERLELSRRSHYILGRHGEKAHHVLMHPTVSRLHAVLQFAASADGDASAPTSGPTPSPPEPAAPLYLYDLGAAHGTYLNKRRVEARTYIGLRVGDMLRFGQSTRLYIVAGPDLFRPAERSVRLHGGSASSTGSGGAAADAAAKQRQRQKVKEAHMRRRQAQVDAANTSKEGGEGGEGGDGDGSGGENGEEEEGGASWGFAEDAPDEDFEDDDEALAAMQERGDDLPEYLREHYAEQARRRGESVGGGIGGGGGGGGADGGPVHEKDKKVHAKLTAKREKLEKLNVESSRIRAKEGSQESGLTSGQSNRLQELEKAMGQIMEQIGNLESNLAQRREARSSSHKAKLVPAKTKAGLKKRRGGGGDDDDDFFDRASARQKRSKKPATSADEVLTFEALSAKQAGVEKNVERYRRRVGEAEHAQRSNAGAGDVDDLDAFMAANQQAAAAERAKVARKSLADELLELKRVQALVALVRPALPALARPAPSDHTAKAGTAAGATQIAASPSAAVGNASAAGPPPSKAVQPRHGKGQAQTVQPTRPAAPSAAVAAVAAAVPAKKEAKPDPKQEEVTFVRPAGLSHKVKSVDGTKKIQTEQAAKAAKRRVMGPSAAPPSRTTPASESMGEDVVECKTISISPHATA